jgi:hypothetical protein
VRAWTVTGRCSGRSETDTIECARQINVTCRNCPRIASSVKVYADAVKGNVSTIKEIGPAQAIQSRAAKVADALNVLFSCDRDHALKILMTFEPFLFSVLLELGSLIAFSYAFSRHRPAKTVPSARKQPTEPVWHTHTCVLEPDSNIVKANVATQPVANVVIPPKSRDRRAYKQEEAQAILLGYLQQHRISDALGASNVAIAASLGLDKSTLANAAVV